MLGVLDHNLTTVAVPLLDPEDFPRSRRIMTGSDRRVVRDDFDSMIFGGKLSADHQIRHGGLASGVSPGNSLSVLASYQSSRLLAEKGEEKRGSLSTSYRSARLLSQLDEASPRLSSSVPEPSHLELNGTKSGLGISPVKSQSSRLSQTRVMETPQTRRTDLLDVTPAPTLPMSTTRTRDASPAPPSEISVDRTISGQSTPRNTSTKRLKTQASKSSFASRFGANWLFGALGGRSQPSFPAPSAATVTRHDVSIDSANRTDSPSPRISSPALPRPVPGAPIITPSTPTLAEAKPTQVTQPLAIASARPPRVPSMDETPTKPRQTGDDTPTPTNPSSKPQTPADSWSRTAQFQKDKSHHIVNPCNPKDNIYASDGRRWRHVNPQSTGEAEEVKWKSICAPACLPLTTDDMPTSQEIDELYELNSYDIACYSDQVSFLIRSDAASANLPLAVMREMASQRLSRESFFQPSIWMS
jgi:hypothetical protein